MDIKPYIAEIKDYPKKGINFKDITPLMLNGDAYKKTVSEIVTFAQKLGVNLIVGPEARGFIMGCPVAVSLGIGFVPVRKPGKLPREVITQEYDLEYGSNQLCLHKNDIKPGDKVLIIDDILATGGTMEATIKLVEQLGGEVLGLSFLLELEELNGQERIKSLGNYQIKILENN